MQKNQYSKAIWLGLVLLAVIIITIVYGHVLATKGVVIRQWNWNNLWLMLPLFPLLLLQQKASLPAAFDAKPFPWFSTVGVGIVFGVLDVFVIKCILHPQPYTELPPFLQPFPYSIFLYTSGALDIELYYRMIPITLVMLVTTWLGKLQYRTTILIVLAILTSIIEPIQQFPDGAIWFILYATISGIAMNAWQFKSYVQHGFMASLTVRLGHYLIWHILLGLYVEGQL